jgi:O-antigen/teichoic acid export membrane protein
MTAALVVADFSMIFVFIGIGPAIIQYPRLKDQHLSTALITSVVLSVAVQIVVWSGAPVIARFFGAAELISIVRVISFVFPIRGLSIVAFSLLQRELRFKDITRIDVSAYLVAFAPVAIGLAILGAGSWALVIAYLVNTLATSVLYLWKKPPPVLAAWNFRSLRDLLHFGTGITLARLAGYLGSTADNLIVGRLLGIRALGLYGRAYGVMSSLVKISGGIVDKVLFPTIAKVQEDPQRLKAGFREAQTAMALTILPISAFLIALAPEAVNLILGSQWMEAVPVFQILAAGMLFRAGHRTSLTVARGTGAAYRIAFVQMMYSVAVVGGAIIGQRWGIEGVAGGVLIAMFLGYVLAGKTALDITGLRWVDFYKIHHQGLIVATGVFLGSWASAEGMRFVNAPAPVVLLAGLLVAASAAYYLARHTVQALIGEDGVRQIRKVITEKRVAFTGKYMPSRKSGL